MEAGVVGQPSLCPACEATDEVEYLVLRVYETGLAQPPFTEVPRVEIALSRGGCHHQRSLRRFYPLDVASELFDQVLSLQRILAVETGLPVLREPPDDPRAGVREPRRPLPNPSTMSSSLELPGYLELPE